MDQVLLIAGSRNPVIADFATHCAGLGRRTVAVTTACVARKIEGPVDFHLARDFSKADYLALHFQRHLRGVVLFLGKRQSPRDRALFDTVVALVKECQVRCVCVISSFEVHLGDRLAQRAEAFLLRSLKGLPSRIVVIRPSHVLSSNSPLGRFLRSCWFGFPLVPGRLQGCCVEGKELFAVIDRELSCSGPPVCRIYTLLGPNRPWRDRLREQRSAWSTRAYACFARSFVPLALVACIVGLLVDFLARRSHYLQSWHLRTLRPRSMQEMLALYNKYNFQHLKVVGYNNGVVHFGHRYPGRTVLSTVRCNQRARLKGNIAEFDAGVTIRQARDVLDKHGRELPVLPNYSYVALGTSFFIPIHGSASDFTTIAETIHKVILYDPSEDRIVIAKRQAAAFGRYLYNLGAEVLLLRLQVQTKPKARYYVNQIQVIRPSGHEILEYFRDSRSSNIEIRKAGSAAQTVDVYQYRTHELEGKGAALDVPRDKLGRLWDHLEENPLSRMIYHRLNRLLAYHVELFLAETDFLKFWETHWSLPILKMQLRFIRRDGFPNSPFRQRDCVAADLFMLKKHRRRFDEYLKATLPAVQLNPGKHTS